MTTERTIGAINPGYGGLSIGVAAALGGGTLAWHAHPGQPFDYAGRMLMRYHHPHAGAHVVIDAPPPRRRARRHRRATPDGGRAHRQRV